MQDIELLCQDRSLNMYSHTDICNRLMELNKIEAFEWIRYNKEAYLQGVCRGFVSEDGFMSHLPQYINMLFPEGEREGNQE